MVIATVPITNQEVPHANAGTDEPRGEETPETTAQGMQGTRPDGVLHTYHVDMLPLDAIYVEGALQDDDLVKVLVHSISLVGLQNPICVVKNDLPDHAAPYRLVSGRQRYAAFLQLQRPTIPVYILSYTETAGEHDVRTALAATEENLVRKQHYSLVELCMLVGQSPDSFQGRRPAETLAV